MTAVLSEIIKKEPFAFLNWTSRNQLLVCFGSMFRKTISFLDNFHLKSRICREYVRLFFLVSLT